MRRFTLGCAAMCHEVVNGVSGGPAHAVEHAPCVRHYRIDQVSRVLYAIRRVPVGRSGYGSDLRKILGRAHSTR
jgi:hypothetical protein